VGGTKIAAGAVDVATGAVRDKRVIPTRPERNGDAVLADVLALARDLIDTRHLTRTALRGAADTVLGIGLGVCELVSPHGEITSDFTIAWKGVPVQAALSEIAPAVVEADVRAHALAEARFGAGTGFDPFVFVSVGTGISACLVQGGTPFAGARGNALVLSTGPVSVPVTCGGPDDAEHTTWVRHVVEEYASGSGIVARFGNGATRAEDVFAAAQAGDARATHILTSAGRSLGSALGWLANVLDPAAIVVGGGLGTARGVYWDSLVRATREHIWAEDTRGLPIVQAALGGDAGVIGAALAAHMAVTSGSLGVELRHP
jgi:glucokinase